MISVAELKEWIAGLPADAKVGIDEGDMTLRTTDDLQIMWVGGLTDSDDEDEPVKDDDEEEEELQ